MNVAERGQDSFPEAEKGVRTRGPGARLKSSSFPMRNGPGNASPSGLGLAPVRFLIVSPTARSTVGPPGPSDPGSAAGWSCRPCQGLLGSATVAVFQSRSLPNQYISNQLAKPSWSSSAYSLRSRGGASPDRKRKEQADLLRRCLGGALGCGRAIPPRRIGLGSAARCVFLGGVGYGGEPVRGHGRPPSRAWTRCRLRV